ncbi:copper chaperone PCu(A)C [Catellatospora tritici]|uniref:copper chaperone PCu(A)C n=1 Tax=Catellatospora tritici TaxID=2851566 RepID=UPI001C2D7CAA|nr:copper chaperone PCu(A)C [Catellatospora tritici]MBV1853469.1 copper chaperone PCu(A)C [Catellatospora tritici]
MTRSITMLLAGGATAAALALTGCSAGMQSQTADQVAAVPGAAGGSIETSPGAGNVVVRDAMVAYPGLPGYKAGADAPLQLRIFNNTKDPITVTGVESAAATSVELTSAGAGKTTPSAEASPSAAASASASAKPSASASASAAASPSPSPSPAAPASTEKITIAPFGYVELIPTGKQFFVLKGLKAALANGASVPLTIKLSNGQSIVIPAVPVATPLDPMPRSPIPLPEGEGEVVTPGEGH